MSLIFVDLHSRCIAGVTTVQFGNIATHVDDDTKAVLARRTKLSEAIDCAQLHWLDQVHGNRCIEVGQTQHEAYSTSAVTADAGTGPGTYQADAQWTTEPGQCLCIMTADCVPVVLIDDQGRVAGAAHAGWQGLMKGVIAELVAQLPCLPQQLNAWIGPAISSQNYEVGEEVWSKFTDFPGVLLPAPGDATKRKLDLALIAELQLRKLGVDQVKNSAWCSYADERFYSHRQYTHSRVPVSAVNGSNSHTADLQAGRMASFIMLRAN